jgi:hypothetical protein
LISILLVEPVCQFRKYVRGRASDLRGSHRFVSR